MSKHCFQIPESYERVSFALWKAMNESPLASTASPHRWWSCVLQVSQASPNWIQIGAMKPGMALGKHFSGFHRGFFLQEQPVNGTKWWALDVLCFREISLRPSSGRKLIRQAFWVLCPVAFQNLYILTLHTKIYPPTDLICMSFPYCSSTLSFILTMVKSTPPLPNGLLGTSLLVF